ncbi:MAG: hypothetical protein A3B70_00660 [Deltaproteobacteria bacterium RIFCSPHIGHO2_02_FULL_40_11]|nr:MAG: hypothetical protein A3B70_00660 [Deltaproteobacteria bacterium RIFCSPHIGHO2_02_FULL_40_11]
MFFKHSFFGFIFLISFTSFAQVQIHEPAVTNIRHNEATLEWTTSTETYGIVKYGTHSKFGFDKKIKEMSQEHLVKLKNLKPATSYFFQIISKDKKGQVTVSDTYTFKTESFEVLTEASLKITSLPQVSTPGSTQATLSWKTNLPASSVVIYGTKQTRKTPYVSTLLSEVHIVLLEDLEPNTRYFYQVKSKDKLNRTVTSTYSSFVTPAPSAQNKLPVLKSGPALGRLTENDVRIEWTTGRSCKTHVKWGKVPLPSFQKKKVIQNEFSKFHVLELSGLSPETRYYYTIYMEDETGQKNNTEIFTFKTHALR